MEDLSDHVETVKKIRLNYFDEARFVHIVDIQKSIENIKQEIKDYLKFRKSNKSLEFEDIEFCIDKHIGKEILDDSFCVNSELGGKDGS